MRSKNNNDLIHRLKKAGLPERRPVIKVYAEQPAAKEESLPLPERISALLDWLKLQTTQNDDRMLYFIMYDIEDNKIRTQIAKYLIAKGCLRVQKSIYLAKTQNQTYKEIADVLKEINELYDNHDSIFLLPVPEDKFRHMRVIGKNVEFDLVTKPVNVLII